MRPIRRAAPRHRPSPLALGALALGLVATLGCRPSEASEASEAAPPALRRLALREVQRDLRPAEPRSVVKLLPGQAELRFECHHAESFSVAEGDADDPLPSWSIETSEPTSARWYWRGPARECQRVIVSCDAIGTTRAELTIYGQKDRIARGSVSHLLNGAAKANPEETIVFEVPGTYFDDRDVVFLELYLIPSVRSKVKVRSIELVGVPPRAAFAPLDGEAQLVRVGDDERRAYGLASSVPLRTTCEVERDSVLSFACAIPPAFAAQPGPVAVELAVVGRHGPLLNKQYPLAAPSDAEDAPAGAPAGSWVDVEFPLGSVGEPSVVLIWRLLGPAPDVDVVCALTPPLLVKRAREAPSVLLVTSDTHRADHVSGARLRHDVNTPELDRLMARGTSFSTCFSTTNLTIPSHVAMLTGTSPRDTRIIDNMTSLSDDAVTLAERFRDAGFLTWAVISADHLDHVHSGLGQGFDRISAPRLPERSASETIARLEGWLDSQPGLPLFVWVHLFDPHMPYAPDDEFLAAQWPEGVDPFDPKLPEPDIPALARSRMPQGLRDVEYMRACYRAEVSELDIELPRLFEHPRLARGVIAFTSDHGESLGAHEIYWDHGGLYPQTTHVPLILAWPDGPRGARVARPVSNVDLGRTLLDLAGLRDQAFPGRSLVEESEGSPEPQFMLSADGWNAAMVHDGWLAVLWLRRQGVWIDGECHELGHLHAFELYDLHADPRCVENLATAERAHAVRMRAALVDWLATANSAGLAGGITTDPDALAGLRALSYTTDVHDVSDAWIDPHCACEQCVAYRR